MGHVRVVTSKKGFNSLTLQVENNTYTNTTGILKILRCEKSTIEYSYSCYLTQPFLHRILDFAFSHSEHVKFVFAVCAEIADKEIISSLRNFYKPKIRECKVQNVMLKNF